MTQAEPNDRIVPLGITSANRVSNILYRKLVRFKLLRYIRVIPRTGNKLQPFRAMSAELPTSRQKQRTYVFLSTRATIEGSKTMSFQHIPHCNERLFGWHIDEEHGPNR